MEWLDNFDNQIIGLDTAPLIYYIEENPKYLGLVEPFFDAFDDGRFTLVTSTITLLEVLIHPLRTGNQELAQQYKEILTRNNRLTLSPLTVQAAQSAANLRATYNLRTPDAIQIAVAIEEGASYFLTNDADLKRVREVHVLTLDDLPDL